MSCAIDAEIIEKTIAFHGHACPGLMIGIRAGEAVLDYFSESEHADLVAVVETDMCGVDAIQYLTCCTFGKGNLIHKDYGKMAFSFFHRPGGKGIRLLLNPDIRQGKDVEVGELAQKEMAGKSTARDRQRMAVLRAEMQQIFMQADLQEMFSITPLDCPPPRPPRVLQSLACENCGEKTMESRTRRFGGRTLCIPCFADVEQKI